MNDQLTIAGGGITGLAAAYIAAKAGKKVRLFEGSNQFGGLLNTFPIGGNRLEYFYHHFFTHDAELNWLLKELGLEKEVFFCNTTMGIFRDGKIHDFNTPMDLLKFEPVGWTGKFRFALTSLFLGKFADWRKYEHLSTLDWFYRWAGNSVTEALWKPLLSIKFGPYADKVPLAWMIGRLRQRMNSRKQGNEQLGYLEGSLQRLLDALLNELKAAGVELISNAALKRLLVRGNLLEGIETPAGKVEGGDFLLTIPGLYLPALLRDHHQDLAQRFEKIEYFGAICVVLELNRPLSSIYWLNVADEGFPFGGIIEQTNLLPATAYNGSHIAYLSRYFAKEEAIAAMKNEEVAELMLASLPKIYSDFEKSWLKKVHVFRTNTAATVCDRQFSQKIPPCQTPIQRLFIANMAHVYPDERSANNAIRVAAQACKVMGIDSSFVPSKASLSGQIGFNELDLLNS